MHANGFFLGSDYFLFLFFDLLTMVLRTVKIELHDKHFLINFELLFKIYIFF